MKKVDLPTAFIVLGTIFLILSVVIAERTGPMLFVLGSLLFFVCMLTAALISWRGRRKKK